MVQESHADCSSEFYEQIDIAKVSVYAPSILGKFVSLFATCEFIASELRTWLWRQHV